jgi:phosphate transport system protein
MFRQLLALFRKDTLMDRAYQRSFQMLDITREMFIEAMVSLRQSEDNQVEIDIYDRDLEVNKYEREVRRHVFNHLAMGGTEKLPSGLILVSIIIDIERIGDLTKNMIELALNYPGRLNGGYFEGELKRIEDAVEDSFIRTRRCFEKPTEESGKDLLDEYSWVNGACDQLVYSLVQEKDPGIRPGDAVSLALYVRWLKRINSHLRNVVTGVVNPFDRIGFKPKESS